MRDKIDEIEQPIKLPRAEGLRRLEQDKAIEFADKVRNRKVLTDGYFERLTQH